jgi:hypothetical protein
VVLELARGQADGKRQTPASLRDDGHCAVPGLDFLAAGQAAEQSTCLARFQDLQRRRRGVGEGGQPVPARDQYQRPGRGGQQRPDLTAASRVIEQQQHPAVRHAVPPHGLPLRQPRRDQRGRGPGRQQQARQSGGWIGGLLARSVTVQGNEQLPVREPGGKQMSRVHGKRGLPDPGHSADRADRDHTRGARLVGCGHQPT